ncbi:hypothetical protein GWI33_001373 [Rhynchophorus ferrugineus]|uniref:Uncharacterized protein n=1 Tax=Rhynchophorus ferrugineus TaxID=354439 RepID=A0A834IUE8_RHYFE|nr:hypothetical protein GWI33_001373 [Rhynchophorus ferrugineus]
MGEFSVSNNTSIGLSAVEITVNSSKSNQNTIFYSSTPTTTTSNGTELLIQPKSYSAIMQDDSSDKVVVPVSSVSAGDENTVTTPSEKNAPSKENEISPSSTIVNDLSDKLSEQVVGSTSKALPNFYHPAEPTTPAGAMWSTALEDGFIPNLTGVNGMGFQNFPNQQQLYGTNQSNQTRRAITASHNFSPQMGRQQSLSNHPLYTKNFGSWTGAPSGPPGQGWNPAASGGAPGGSTWNRGRSVPNLTPLQQMGVGITSGRKPSPTFNQQQVISPVKFRRSTSYPGKGPFPQPPTFEITNMDETRELLPFQERGTVSANGSSPLENMRGLEHYLNDIMSPQPNSNDIKVND